jgi:hypothetical protein
MKEYIEFEGIKLLIKEKGMKSGRGNQYNTGSQKPWEPMDRQPFKRRDEVTFGLIVQCLFGAGLWGAFLYGLMNWVG